MINCKDTKYLDNCYAELERKQDALIKQHRLDAYGMFDYDLTTGKIQFKDENDIVKVEANFVPAGSFSEESQSWMWAWANPSVEGALKEQAESLKALEQKTGNEMMSHSTISADEATAWEITAMSCDLLDGQGVFAAPVSDLLIFLVLKNVTST
ncbi:DUF6882 domain-containing protein [Pseudomonadota bacterium]